MSNDEIENSKCKNKHWRDTFGNFRNFKLSNIKHHWWWKLNIIKYSFNFDQILLLEEDYVLGCLLFVIQVS